MPSKHSLHASLTEHLQSFVAEQVASGRFGTASEVVRAALRLLEETLAASAVTGRPDWKGTAADLQNMIATTRRDGRTEKGPSA